LRNIILFYLFFKFAENYLHMYFDVYFQIFLSKKAWLYYSQILQRWHNSFSLSYFRYRKASIQYKSTISAHTQHDITVIKSRFQFVPSNLLLFLWKHLCQYRYGKLKKLVVVNFQTFPINSSSIRGFPKEKHVFFTKRQTIPFAIGGTITM